MNSKQLLFGAITIGVLVLVVMLSRNMKSVSTTSNSTTEVYKEIQSNDQQ